MLNLLIWSDVLFIIFECWLDLFFTKLGFIALRYRKVKTPKTKKTIKLKTKNFFRIELELNKLDNHYHTLFQLQKNFDQLF